MCVSKYILFKSIVNAGKCLISIVPFTYGELTCSSTPKLSISLVLTLYQVGVTILFLNMCIIDCNVLTTVFQSSCYRRVAMHFFIN